VGHRVAETACRVDRDARHGSGLGQVVAGDDRGAVAHVPRGRDEGQCPGHRAQRSIQRQLGNEGRVGQFSLQLP